MYITILLVNYRFSKLEGQPHPTIWTIIVKIRLKIAADETKLDQIQLRVPQQKRQKTVYKEIQIQLKKLCDDYFNDIRDIENILTAISYTISHKTSICNCITKYKCGQNRIVPFYV